MEATKGVKKKCTGWRTGPNGEKYRYCHREGSNPLSFEGFWVEYKGREPKMPPYPLLPFIVRVRGEVWHVKSKDAESAARLFYSADPKSTGPKKGEIVVEEDRNGKKKKAEDYRRAHL